jgi:two-component system LytT family sensor kinase
MQLQMKTRCGKCGAALNPDGEAYICSYECTFCAVCASECQKICPNCGGDLAPRPRRPPTAAPATNANINANNQTGASGGVNWWLVWAVSFGVWGFIALLGSASTYEVWKATSYPMKWSTVLAASFWQILTYAPLTPIAFALALRFPVQRENWLRRSLLHLGFGFAFSVAHIALRGATPYGYWDAQAGKFASAIWNSHTHSFHIVWPVFRRMFFQNVVDDITGTYLPIVLVGHALSYYGRVKDHEIHSAKLETELARSHLQTLKSHLQPHFLFNTMHSISSLMLTDVKAADKMMTRLSDLLRMSLESDGMQITTLRRELEFVSGYLEIEKIRLEERLNVVEEIPPEILDARVPHLTMQPLVENAIRHGVSRLSAGGTVWIIARRDGRQLDLRVRNEGPSLVDAARNPLKKGLGLRTTRERLATLYGAEQSLEIHDCPGGVEVSVRIPFRVEPNSAVDEGILVRRTAKGETA